MLEIQSLVKSFGRRKAVAGVSFRAERGTVLGVLGPNGAGKSTTLRMIAGVLEPDSGDVLIQGKSILADRRGAQMALGYLPEGAPMYQDLTPHEFLDFMASARGLNKNARRDAADRAIADARISTVSSQRISTLSKGFRRRVGLAAAILHDPPVLILDEPTDGLDPNQRQAVRALIARMAPDKAILISTHTLTEVTAMCSQALIIDSGVIVAEGTPDSIARKSEEGTLEAAFMKLTGQREAEYA